MRNGLAGLHAAGFCRRDRSAIGADHLQALAKLRMSGASNVCRSELSESADRLDAQIANPLFHIELSFRVDKEIGARTSGYSFGGNLMRFSNAMLVMMATSVFAGPALAADFAGPRAELRGGWDRTTLDLHYDDGIDSFKEDGHDDGVNFGAEVGYDAPIGPSMIAGGYAGVEFATTKECSEIFGNDEACLKLGRNFTVGARLGGKISPAAMLYIKGGYSNGQIKATYENSDDPSWNGSDRASRGGFHFGLGGEMAFGPNTYVRAEYVRTNYNDYDYSDSDFDIRLDAHRDQLILGFGARF